MLVNSLQAFRNSVNCTAHSSVQSTLFLKAWSEPTCRWALSLFFIVSALRAYKQLRVPLAWRGGTKKTAAGRINKKIAAENKKVVTRVHWYRFMAPTGTNAALWSRLVRMPLFSPGWSHQPGPKVFVSRPLGCWKEAFGPGWWHQPGLKGALVPVGFTNRDQFSSYITST